MIARLRRAHAVAVSLSPFLLAAFAIALFGKKPDAISNELPADARGATTRELGSVSDILRAKETPSSLGGTFVIGAHDAGRLLLCQKGEPSPDTIAYWTKATGAIDALPQDAHMLGPVGTLPRNYAIPAAGGQVVFYSLAHGTVVGHASLEGN